MYKYKVMLITVQDMSKCTFHHDSWHITNLPHHISVYLVTWRQCMLYLAADPLDLLGASLHPETWQVKKKANLDAKDMLKQQGLMGMSCENRGSLTGTDSPAIWLSTTGPKQSAATKRAGGEPGSGLKLQFACQQECWGPKYTIQREPHTTQTHHNKHSTQTQTDTVVQIILMFEFGHQILKSPLRIMNASSSLSIWEDVSHI